MTPKPAYELDGISVAFVIHTAMGDTIIAKKIFEAIVTVEKNCKIDFVCNSENSVFNVMAFYGGNKNLNCIVDLKFFNKNVKQYDLVIGTSVQAVDLIFVNLERLKSLSPALAASIIKINTYNQKYMKGKDITGRTLFNMARARILGLNRYTILACDGALPIYDSHVEINLSLQWESEFKKLGLKKYITVGSNGGNFNRHVIKEWPARYYIEFISLLKSKMPEIEVVQTGGNNVIKLENADRYLLGENLELMKYVFKNSLLHVDCEGGPVHLASQLGTKCVVLFGVTDVNYYGYKQNINIVSEVCSPCYFVWENDKTCLLKSEEPLCMLSITPQKVFDVAYRYLNSLSE